MPTIWWSLFIVSYEAPFPRSSWSWWLWHFTTFKETHPRRALGSPFHLLRSSDPQQKKNAGGALLIPATLSHQSKGFLSKLTSGSDNSYKDNKRLKAQAPPEFAQWNTGSRASQRIILKSLAPLPLERCSLPCRWLLPHRLSRLQSVWPDVSWCGQDLETNPPQMTQPLEGTALDAF